MTLPQPPGTPYHPFWYVSRPHEESLTLRYLEYARAVFLWGPARQGRSWLATHVSRTWQVTEAGRRLVFISFHGFGHGAFASLDACLLALGQALADNLDGAPDGPLARKLAIAWKGRGDGALKVGSFLSRHVLADPGPLLLVLDNMDILQTHGLYDELTGVLRAWVDRAANQEAWKRLHLLVSVSTNPAGLGTAADRSPFYNVSEPVFVGDFGRAQMTELTGRYGQPWAPVDVERLMSIVGGHPFLARAALSDIVDGRYPLNRLVDGGQLGPSLVADQVRAYRLRLDASDLGTPFLQIAADHRARVEPGALEALIRSGFVVRDDDGTHRLRYGLYQRLLHPDQETAPSPRKRRLFYCYADEDEALHKRLEVHLKLLEREGHIESWHRRRVLAGEDWKKIADARFDEAEVILLLVSADFIASDYCWDDEVARALVRHEAGTAVVVPILLRPCDWRSTPFARLQALPVDAIPVTRWVDQDEAWVDVAQGLRRRLA